MLPRRELLQMALAAAPLDFFRGRKEIDEPEQITIPQREPQVIEKIVERLVVPEPAFLMNQEYTEPEPEVLIGLSPRWCRACKSFNKAKLAPIVQWQDKEMKGCPQYPAVYDPVSQAFYTGASLNSLDMLQRSIKSHMMKKGMTSRHPEMLNMGEVDQSYLQLARQLLGISGSLSRKKAELFNFGFVSLKLPENVGASWSNQVVQGLTETFIKFSPKPVLRIKVVDQAISGLVVADNYVKLNIDWFPDISINAKGVNPQSIPMGFPMTRWSYPGRDFSWTTDDYSLSHHLIIGHRQPSEQVNDLTYDEQRGLHSDCHNGRVKAFTQTTINPGKWS